MPGQESEIVWLARSGVLVRVHEAGVFLSRLHGQCDVLEQVNHWKVREVILRDAPHARLRRSFKFTRVCHELRHPNVA